MKPFLRCLFTISVLALFLVFSHTAVGQTPDSAHWQSSSEYVFSSAAFPQKTAEFTVTIFENGNPVPENTPVALSINYGRVEGATLFKTDESGNTTGGGAFYFKTDAEGKVKVDYIPDYTPRSFHSFQNQYPDSSLNFVWQKHDEQNELKYYTWSSLVLAVNITDPNNDQSAQIVANIPLGKESVIPILLGPSYVVVDTKSKNNDEYIFTASGVNPEKAELTVTVYDGEQNPVPAGTPFGIRLNHPGEIPSEQVIQEPESENSFQDYVLIAGENGQLTFDYFAPQMVPPPFSDWYKGSVFETFGYTKDEAWEFYKQSRWEIEEGYSDIGYAAISEFSGVTRNTFDPENLLIGTNTLGIIELESSPPVLVGADKIFIGTTSTRGDEYVFASALHTESADIFVSVVDSRDRPVPKGTPIALGVNSAGLVSIRGKLVGKGIFAVQRSASNNDDILEPSFTSVFFRLGEEGISNLTYIAPYVNLAPKRLHNSGSYTYDELNRAIGLFGMPARFDCGYPCQFPDQVSWNVDASLLPGGEILLPEPDSKVPVLIGPDYAEVTVKPDTIKSGRIIASIKGTIFDPRGLPVPSNTNIVIIPSKGNVPDAPLALRLTSGNNGEAFGTYKSDTRPIGQSASPVTISMYTPNNTGDPDGWLLGSDVFYTKGGAVNKATHKYGQYLLGLSITETIQGLNPLKAYSSLKRFKGRVDNVGEKYKKLLDNIGTGNLSQSDYDAYENAWVDVQSSFFKLIQDVPGTSITGPGGSVNVGGLMKELSINGTRRALLNTARTQVLGKSLKKSMAYSVDVFVQQQFFANQSQMKAPFISDSDPEPFFQNIDLELTSDFYSLPSASGTFELYGVEFEIPSSDSLISLGVLAEGTQAPLIENVLPPGMSIFDLGIQGSTSPGIIEITEIDEQNNTIKGAALLFVSSAISDDFELIVNQEFGIEADTLDWFKETRLIFQDSTVLESKNFFFGSALTPHPFINDLEVNIDQSFVIGSFDTDSSIQNIALNKPAFVEIVDSALAVDYTAYQFDEENAAWNNIGGFIKKGDTLSIPIGETSIIGLGKSSASINEPPFLSSIRDTTLETGATLVLTITANDLDDDEITFSVSTDTSAVQASFSENILTVTPDVSFIGESEIEITVSDGELSAVTRFIISVQPATNVENNSAIPDKAELLQNYPNPFNPTTNISYRIPVAGKVSLVVYDILGRRVATLIDGEQIRPGRHTIVFNASSLSSGVYIYRLTTESSVLTKKLTVIK